MELIIIYTLNILQVFFRETAYNMLRTKIDDEFLRRVSVLQGWFRALHYRKQFLQKRAAVTVLQVFLENSHHSGKAAK